MKTPKILFALLPFFLIFSSCSSDDDTTNEEVSEVVQKLLGKWRYDGLTINGGEFEEDPTGEMQIMEFKTGGVVTNTSDGEVSNGTYSVNNNSLTITIDGETAVYNISQLTNTNLRLSTTIEADEEPGDDDVVFYFTKV